MGVSFKVNPLVSSGVEMSADVASLLRKPITDHQWLELNFSHSKFRGFVAHSR